MFDNIDSFFHRVGLSIDQYDRINPFLYRIHHGGSSRLVYFPTLTVSPWNTWRNGGKQFQISFFTKHIREARSAHPREDILVVCTPIGYDDELLSENINKVDKYLTACQTDYANGGNFANVDESRRGPSYRHSDFAVILEDFDMDSTRPDVRTLFCLQDASDDTIYTSVLTWDGLEAYYKGKLVHRAVRLNLGDGADLQMAQQAFMNCISQLPTRSVDFDTQSEGIVFTQHNTVSCGSKIREYNQSIQVLEDLHIQLQQRLKDLLENNAREKGYQVSVEWLIGNNRRVDVATHFGDDPAKGELHLYEIKTAETATDCVRQAIGQLYEYTYLCGLEAFSITKLIVVGPAPSNPNLERMLQKLSEGQPYRIHYLHIPLG